MKQLSIKVTVHLNQTAIMVIRSREDAAIGTHCDKQCQKNAIRYVSRYQT